MTSASLQDKTVHELQELAQTAPTAARARTPSRLSRAARLHLIDILSRWSGPGLALIAGVCVYLAIIAGRAYPARAAAWTLMVLAALWACRRLRGEFRSGARLADRPFRWRAAYTSCLTVLGVIVASAPILLAPSNAPFAFAAQVFGLAIMASFAGALFHSAHLPSAAALAGPGAAFAILTGVRAAETGLLVATASTAILGIVGLVLANRSLERNAARRYPRTSFIRRELEQTALAEERPNKGVLQA